MFSKVFLLYQLHLTEVNKKINYWVKLASLHQSMYLCDCFSLFCQKLSQSQGYLQDANKLFVNFVTSTTLLVNVGCKMKVMQYMIIFYGRKTIISNDNNSPLVR